jgi:hypothetical protein
VQSFIKERSVHYVEVGVPLDEHRVVGLQGDNDEAGFDRVLGKMFGVDGQWMIAPETSALERATQILERLRSATRKSWPSSL